VRWKFENRNWENGSILKCANHGNQANQENQGQVFGDGPGRAASPFRKVWARLSKMDNDQWSMINYQ
jgi:hypothetical protein